jgi:hypothetical protein
MKVLHLPLNIASQMSITVRALRRIGVDARGLDVSPRRIQSSEGIETIPIARLNKARRLFGAVRYLPRVLAAIGWADVIHWHYATPALPRFLDMRWARLLKKPGIVEFWGSDIRIIEIEAQDNPYYAALGTSHGYDETREGSRRKQARFAEAGMPCLVSCKSLMPYVQRDLFPKVYFVRQRVWLDDFEPSAPAADNPRPIIVHSPSDPVMKGTDAVLAAIERLRNRYTFEFRLLQNIPHSEAMKELSRADIYLDQFVLGGHGIGALEAMAFGKPVVCYIKASMLSQYPPDLPIVNANQDNLVKVLEGLLENGGLRHSLGLKGWDYLKKYHDAIAAAQELTEIYQNLL